MNASLKNTLEDWCRSPISLWDPKTTELVVNKEWEQLKSQFLWAYDDYSSPGYILRQAAFDAKKTPIFTNPDRHQIYLEDPSQEIFGFYSENDLIFDGNNHSNASNTKEKLTDALTLLDSIPELMKSIELLVRVICILRSEDGNCDVSYSHPKLPFSIFVSLCGDRGPVATARAAESILHEAMHLKLSLIQKSVELLNPKILEDESYFSPWRQEYRPINGVLHGVFVFRAIFDYFLKLEDITTDKKIEAHAQKRIKEMELEFLEIPYFFRTDKLNSLGKQFTKSLLAI